MKVRRITVARSVALACVTAIAALGVNIPAAYAGEAERFVPGSATSAVTTPVTVGDHPADGIYAIELVNTPGHVLAKSTTCADGEGGDSVYPPLDTTRFSQKWKLILQPNGAYVIASLCQPTVLLTLDAAGKSTYRYGTDGQIGELGAWNPSYDYRVAHSSLQEWTITEEVPGQFRIRNVVTGGYFTLVKLVPVN